MVTPASRRGQRGNTVRWLRVVFHIEEIPAGHRVPRGNDTAGGNDTAESAETPVSRQRHQRVAGDTKQTLFVKQALSLTLKRFPQGTECPAGMTSQAGMTPPRRQRHQRVGGDTSESAETPASRWGYKANTFC